MHLCGAAWMHPWPDTSQNGHEDVEKSDTFAFVMGIYIDRDIQTANGLLLYIIYVNVKCFDIV